MPSILDKGIKHINVGVFMFVCMCVCEICALYLSVTYIHTNTFNNSYSLLFPETSFLMNLELILSNTVGGQQASKIFPFPLPSNGVTGALLLCPALIWVPGIHLQVPILVWQTLDQAISAAPPLGIWKQFTNLVLMGLWILFVCTCELISVASSF